MVIDFAQVLIIALLADWFFRQCRLPGLVGMLFVGVILGPNLVNLISPELVEVGVEFRLMALVVILLRAGLKLNRETLNRVGGRALLLSCVPALFEGAAVAYLGHQLLGLSLFAACVLGTVLSAVSPAVVVPLMLDYIERNKGTKSGAPTMVLAGSSLEDTIVIVVFGALLALLVGEQTSVLGNIAKIPLAIGSGIMLGFLVGVLLCHLFDRFNPRATKRAITLIALSLLLLRFEQWTNAVFPFAALPMVMAMGFIMLELRSTYAQEMAVKLSKIWVFAEILLFVMVGAQVNLRVMLETGLMGFVVLAGGLVARAVGVNLCLLRGGMTSGTRLFVTMAYLPKATVQAAIGAAPLIALSGAGLDTRPGEIILAMAVLAIVVTAPLGAWATSWAGERFLDEDATIKVSNGKTI